MYEGYGEFYCTNFVYKGRWKDNCMHCENGILEYMDGTVYKGGFKKGKKHGDGVVEYEDGTSYKGEFFEDLYSGRGKKLFLLLLSLVVTKGLLLVVSS